MPIYEYACRECGHEFELLVRNQEKPSCPNCGRRRLSKRLSVPAAHTRGSSQPACPAKESGSCGVPNCYGNRCGINDWPEG